MPNASEKRRAAFLRDAFKITQAEWDKILTHQRGVCFACGRPSVKKRLSTDHSHETGLLRGLLCHACNALLGKIENNFKRYGLHKIEGLTVIRVVLRLALYLQEPPAVAALGREIIGYPGRIGTKEFRKWVKKGRQYTKV